MMLNDRSRYVASAEPQGFQPFSEENPCSPSNVGVACRQSILPSAEAQLPLFDIPVDLVELEMRRRRLEEKKKRKRSRKRNRRVHRKKGLQYKIELRIRKTDRKLPYRPKDNLDHRLTAEAEVRSWTDEGIVKLHKVLLYESLRTARRRDSLSKASHAEIWYWINRRRPDEPFSFESCCEYSGVDPDVMRPMLRRLLSETPPLVDMLRQSILAAEAGNRTAIEWCLSDNEGELTFVSACRAVGFDPQKARKELRLPGISTGSPDLCRAVAI